MNLDFVSRRHWYYLVSALILIPGLISLLIPPRLKLGLEFSSGSAMTVLFQRPVEQGTVREALISQGYPDAILQRSQKEAYLLEGVAIDEAARARLETELNARLQLQRLAAFPNPQATEMPTLGLLFPEKVASERLVRELAALGYEASPQPAALDAFLLRTRTLEVGEREELEAALAALGPLVSYDLFQVSPIVAAERARYAFYAVLAASAAILLYITWAFRRMPKPFRWGVCAVVALVHDTMVVIGLFSLLGKALGMEVDSMFITGLLTVIGYSVHDTIVVFDRIRENIARRGLGQGLEATINNSILETLSRSLNTSLTVLFVLLALVLLGGVTLRPFILVLIMGITVGTYSSICIASQLLVTWERGDLRRALGWLRARGRTRAA